MARWHKPSCTTPLVIIDHTSKTPHCTSCGSSPNIEELVAAVAGFSPLPPVPPDEPLDNLNLFWPPTVKYTYPDTHQPKIDPDELNTSPPTSTSCITINNTLKTEPVDPSTIPAYRRALKPDEFRLLRLPYGGPEDPIHITLEICHDDDYPNYETCSYSWGGEEGDSTLCKPVFVGEYWDILFQTRNCWDMLRCLRPSTKNSQRVLWVDAICINQRDTYGEREEQIEKMFQLYRKADRVVVFLGADMFGDLGGRTYPKRRELSEIPRFKTGDDGQICLVDMLNRRYFERLWVVQELLISQIAVIRVRDTEYWITNTTADKFYDSDHDWDWEAMPAPWLGQAAKGAFTGQQTSGFSSLLRLMKVTSNCLGADPRDKVFGILALAQANAEHGDLIRPDYSLSLQHIMVGTLAHCLVVDKYDDFLWEACGVQGWDEYPSWAPAWRSPNF
ncbi:heterokaryon incompatibility protein-domain-containing protein, partial [Cercophora samala]